MEGEILILYVCTKRLDHLLRVPYAACGLGERLHDDQGGQQNDQMFLVSPRRCQEPPGVPCRFADLPEEVVHLPYSVIVLRSRGEGGKKGPIETF